MLLDGGRSFTKVICRMTLDDSLDYQRNFSDPHRDSLIKWCDFYHIDYRDIFRERDADEIFWSDSVQFVTPKRLAEWHEMHLKHNYSHGYCLKTNSSGGKCYGCGTCPSGADIKSVTQRNLSHMPVSEAIANLAGQRVRTVTRFVFDKVSAWNIYSNDTLAHYVTSQMLQRDDSLVKAFHKVNCNNTSWVSDNDQKDWYSGFVVWDVEWKDLVYAADLQKFVDDVNSTLHIGKIKAIYDIDSSMELSTKANASYVAMIDDISLGRITERFNAFDWNVKVVEKAAQGAEVVKHFMPELRDKILFVPSGSSVLCFMNLPITISPYYALSSILGIPEAVCRHYNFRVTDVGMPSDIVCRNDGNVASYSCTLNKQLSECPVCRGKKVLYLLTHK